ncbi:MAG: flippase [Ignavibacteriales bacterium]|nr:MAG: flippase [Ignavibacteriales bacterium]
MKTKIDFGSSSFKKYFKNTSWLLTERTIRLIVNFLINIYVIRYLGPDDFGLLSYAISFAALFTTFSTLGLDNIIIRELVKEPGKRDVYLGSVFLMKVAGALSSLILIAGTLILTNDSSLTVVLIFLIASSTVFQSLNVIDFYFQSKVLSKYPVIVQFITVIISAIIKFILIQSSADLWFFAGVITLESILWAIGFIIVYRLQNLKILNWRFNKEISKQLLKDAWPLVLSGLFIAVYMKIDQVMIKNMLNDEEVGFYAAAVKISEAWYFIPMAVSSSLFPAIVNAKKIGMALYESRMQKLYDILTWMSFGIAIPVTFFSEAIIKILFGPEYISSSGVLTIYIWAGVSVFLGVASSQYLLTENLTKLSFYRTFVGMILNIVLNFLLIPIYGIIGSAVATLISYTLATFSIGINRKTFSQFIMMLKSIFFITFFLYIKQKWLSR